MFFERGVMGFSYGVINDLQERFSYIKKLFKVYSLLHIGSKRTDAHSSDAWLRLGGVACNTAWVYATYIKG
jgi:hypothetical protein